MKIENYLNIEELVKAIDEGFIENRKHGSLPLNILTYSRNTVFEDNWTDVTCKCRGLIVDDDGTVISRPFSKFFNVDTSYRPETWVSNLPTTQPRVQEKLDGCFLGSTKLNLWDGGTISIREVVNNRLAVRLIGLDENGTVVPCDVVGWFNNGRKDHWLYINVDCNVSLDSGMGAFGNRMLVTPNHHVYVNGKFKAVSEVKVGDVMSSYELIPDKTALHYIESSLLGDGSLYPAGNAFRFTDSHKQEHDEFNYSNALNLGECSISTKSITSGFGTKMTQVCSKAYKSLGSLREKWYPSGMMKAVPEDLNWMDDFSVAKWYMDDGSLGHNEEQQDRANFSTNGFTESDVSRLAKRLEDMYNVKTTVYFSKGWSIRVNSGRDSSIKSLWTAIAPHIIDCMRYKLPKEYRQLEYRIVRLPGKELRQKLDAIVLNIGTPEDNDTIFTSGRTGFDIKTTTGNYMAKGLFVHNSLGILYTYQGISGVASKGSFHSDHAKWATAWYQEHCKDAQWPEGYTVVFEMICQEVQTHVVRYSTEDQLVLLALINNETGEEASYENLHYWGTLNEVNVVDHYDKTLGKVLNEDRPNTEGYVLSWPQVGTVPLKVKIKHDTFLALQKIVHNATPKNILQLLVDGRENEIDEWMATPNPELNQFVRGWFARFSSAFGTLLVEASQTLINAKLRCTTRKEIAEFFLKENKMLTPVCFAMMDGKDFKKILWKIMKDAIKESPDVFFLYGEQEEDDHDEYTVS